MPPVAAAAVAIFATASAVTAASATIAAITVFGVSLGTIATVGLALSTVAAAFIFSKALPKPSSQTDGSVLQVKLDPHAPVPVVYGRTGVAGYTVYKRTGGGSKNPFLYAAAVLSVGPITAFESATFDDLLLAFSSTPSVGSPTVVGTTPSDAESKTFKNKLRLHWNVGPTTALASLPSRSGVSPPLMTDATRFNGLAHVLTTMEFSTDAFPGGEPRKQVYVIQGRKLWDPRKDSTFPGGSGAHRRDDPETWEFSENPYLAALDWTLGYFVGGERVYGIGAPVTTVDLNAFVAAANVADANNWKVGGQLVSDDDKFAGLASILQSGGGLPVSSAGRISVLVNAPKASVFTISEGDIIGDTEITTSTPYRDRKNTIIPQSKEESLGWETAPGEEISVGEWIAEDGGQKRSTEIVYPMVQRTAQAHQLATYELANSREFLTVTLTGKPRLLNVRVGEAVTLRNPANAIAERKMIVMSREIDPRSLTVNLMLRSETDAKHAFALGQSQVPPVSPTVNGFDPMAPAAPGANAWAITDTAIVNADGVSMSALVVTGENDNPNTASVIVEYRPTASSTWTFATSGNNAATRFVVTDVTPGDSYQVAISYRTVRGALSPRLILGPVTAGADIGTVPWNPNGPGPIVGRPPVLDPNDDAYLDGSFFRYGDETLGELVTRIQGETANAVAMANAAVNSAGSNLGNAVTNLQVAVANSIANAGQLGSRINTVEAFNANAATRLSNIETVSANSIARISSLESTATGPDGTTATRITNLESNSATAFGQISSLQTTTTNNAISLASQISGLSANFSTANSATTARIIQAEQTQATANSAITSTLSGLSGTINTQGQNITGAINRLDQVDINLTGKASVTTVSNLQLQVNGYSGSISNLESLTQTLSGQVEAKKGVVLNVNGYLSGYTLANNGQSSIFAIQADAFRLTSGSSQSSPFQVSGGTTYIQNAVFRGQVDVKSASSGRRMEMTNEGIKIYDDNNILRVHIGTNI